MDATDDLLDRVHGLSDLELAILLSLVSEEHCVIGTPADGVDDLANELRLITRNVFGLQCVFVDCHELMTLEELTASLLFPAVALPETADGNKNEKNIKRRSNIRSYSGGSGSDKDSNEAPDADLIDHRLASPFLQTTTAHSPGSSCGDLLMPKESAPATPLAAPSITVSASTPNAAPSLRNVVIAKHLNKAPEAVQIQMLELLRTQRIYTSAAPRPFLVVGVVAATRGFGWNVRHLHSGQGGREPHMTAYLNDFFCMGHWHDQEDGFPNLEEETEAEADADTCDASSEKGNHERRAKHSQTSQAPIREASSPFLPQADIHRLTALSNSVRVDIDVLRYLMNIVAFLRVHRVVATVGPNASGLSSISPAATKHFQKLVQCLATLHRLDYVTPALVALAARKTYLHRIRTTVVEGCRHRDGHSSLPIGSSMEHERSMQWGSERAAVEALVDGVTAEDVIEDVLALVVSPV